MNLQVPIYPSTAFTWKGNSGVSEISDLGQYSFKGWSQLYDDACDIGFAIQSERTGKLVRFSMGKVDTDGEDIHGWNFLSECGNYKILVVND